MRSSSKKLGYVGDGTCQANDSETHGGLSNWGEAASTAPHDGTGSVGTAPCTRGPGRMGPCGMVILSVGIVPEGTIPSLPHESQESQHRPSTYPVRVTSPVPSLRSTPPGTQLGHGPYRSIALTAPTCVASRRRLASSRHL